MAARRAEDAMTGGPVEAALFIISHPDLDAPIRLSTDNGDILFHTPAGPVYGTKSAWRSPGGGDFLFAAVTAILPGDEEEALPSAQIAVENVSSEIARLLHSISGRATVDMALVHAHAPDAPEAQWLGMAMVKAGGDAGLITLDISHDSAADEPFPSGRLTRERFPGMHP